MTGPPEGVEPGSGEPRLPWRVVATVAVGSPLTPLNSTMIAVALVQIQAAFEIGLVSTTWLISSFYIAAAIGQPLLGRIVDRAGARRVYCVGLGVVSVTGLLTPLATEFWMLVVSRVLLALGTSAAYPAGMAIYRQQSGSGNRMPTAALAVTSIAASSAAMLGPVVGGLVVGSAGWQAIFLVNVPLTLLGIVLALSWIPADAPTHRRSRGDLLQSLDLPGVGLFAAALTAGLAFLLSGRGALWWLAIVAVALATAFLYRERRTSQPFLDLAWLRSQPALVAVLVRFLLVNVIFYSVYFALPVWLESVQGRSPDRVGLLILPSSVISILVAPVAARAVRTRGSRPVLIVGLVLMTLSCVGVLFLRPESPAEVVLAISALIGLPNALTNMSLQAALYEAAPVAFTGLAAGMYQSSRYVGAVLASAVLGALTGSHMDAGDLAKVVGAALVVMALLLGTLRARAGPEAGSGGVRQ